MGAPQDEQSVSAAANRWPQAEHFIWMSVMSPKNLYRVRRAPHDLRHQNAVTRLEILDMPPTSANGISHSRPPSRWITWLRHSRQ